MLQNDVLILNITPHNTHFKARDNTIGWLQNLITRIITDISLPTDLLLPCLFTVSRTVKWTREELNAANKPI